MRTMESEASEAFFYKNAYTAFSLCQLYIVCFKTTQY
jgi:hypothetical protein